MVTARIQLGRSFSVKPKATEVVAHGLYSRIRNPMYVFLDLMVVGVILMLNFPWALLVAPVLIVAQSLQAYRDGQSAGSKVWTGLPGRSPSDLVLASTLAVPTDRGCMATAFGSHRLSAQTQAAPGSW